MFYIKGYIIFPQYGKIYIGDRYIMEINGGITMKRTRAIFGLIFSLFCIFACLGVSTFATDYEAPPQAEDGYYELDSYEGLVWCQQYIDYGN